MDLNFSAQERCILCVTSIVANVHHGFGKVVGNQDVARNVTPFGCLVGLLDRVKVYLQDRCNVKIVIFNLIIPNIRVRYLLCKFVAKFVYKST